MFYLLVYGFETQVQAFAQGLLGTTDEIHFLHFLALVFVLTWVIMIVISKLSPADYVPGEAPENKVDMTPWKHAKAAGAILCLLVIGTYVGFAQ